jgi:hypothetical protein
MKALRFPLPIALMFLATLAFAQSDPKKSFEQLKSLAGTWEGKMQLDPPIPAMNGKSATVTMRVTSMGHTLMHEMKGDDRPDDPITMFVLEGDHILLTHYCDADNRPRMAGTLSPDGKTLDFNFLDVTGNMKYGHMQHATFTFIDANHHVEDWTFLMAGDKPMHAHAELTRTK